MHSHRHQRISAGAVESLRSVREHPVHKNTRKWQPRSVCTTILTIKTRENAEEVLKIYGDRGVIARVSITPR